jgi:hypothetical protein
MLLGLLDQPLDEWPGVLLGVLRSGLVGNPSIQCRETNSRISFGGSIASPAAGCGHRRHGLGDARGRPSIALTRVTTL